MLSGRTSTCAPARADPGYLEDQIAFGATLLFGNVGAEASPPFRALFLKILQDLENKRETRDSRKRARRARSAERSAGIGRREVCGAGLWRVQAHTGCTNTETSGRGLIPYGCASARRDMLHLRGEVARAAVRVARLVARLRGGAHLHTTPSLRCRRHHPPRTPLLTDSPLRNRWLNVVRT